MKFIIQILSNALAILAAAYLVPGFNFYGSLALLLLAGMVMGVVNFFVRPVVKLITAPLILLTLGLFSLIINAFLLWLVELIVPGLEIKGIMAYVFGVIVIGLVNFGINLFTKPLVAKK